MFLLFSPHPIGQTNKTSHSAGNGVGKRSLRDTGKHLPTGVEWAGEGVEYSEAKKLPQRWT